MQRLALKLIRFYQNYLSFLNGPTVCRFQPRCSEYTYQAIQKYGILAGTLMGIKRLSRCHPFHKAGIDPVV